jgi:periplasmic divalent cation tolerance protein
MTDKIVVFSTCESAEQAVKVARALVEQRLAACVNIVPGVTSVYRWKGAVEEAQEWLLAIKSTRSLFDRLSETLAAQHSYEVPEAIALPIVAGSQSYLAWLTAETAPQEP